MSRIPSFLLPNGKRRRKSADGMTQTKTALLFLAPSLLGVCVFALVPFADMMRRSVTSDTGARFIGLSSYQNVITNKAFLQAVSNTARFVSLCIPLLLILSLALALLLRLLRPRGRALRTAFLIPMAVPVASIVLLWQALFHSQGLFNTLLVHAGGQAVNFMGTETAFWVLIVTYLWKNNGYTMILWLAGLDGIAGTLYEAAAADGAGLWRQFWHITLPGILPTLALTTVLSLLNSFKVFREAYLVAGSYPHKSIYLLQHLFNNWFLKLEIGRMSAAAVLVAAALMGLILMLYRMWRRDE